MHCKSVLRGFEQNIFVLLLAQFVQWSEFMFASSVFFTFSGAVLDFSFYLCLTYERIKDLNVKPKNLKLLAENIWSAIGKQRQIAPHTCKVKEKEDRIQIGENSPNYSHDKGLIFRIHVEPNKLRNNKRTKRLWSTKGQGSEQTWKLRMDQ